MFHLDTVWRYLTQSWLTLHDRARRRTRIERTQAAPWWEALSQLTGWSVAGSSPVPNITRDRSPRVDRERLLKQAFGIIASLAAVDGTADVASTVLTVKDYAEGRGRKQFRDRVSKARRRYGIKRRLAAVPAITLLPDALPEHAEAA